MPDNPPTSSRSTPHQPPTAPAAPSARTGVLYVTTGSPTAPTPEAVRGWLEPFLSDKRIVNLPAVKWMPILHGIILPRRSPKTAARYQEIWLEEGSPLLVYTERQRAGLERSLAAAGLDVPVVTASRYNEPTVRDALRALLDELRCERVVVLPVYPQYASVTNGTMVQEVFAALSERRRIPSVDFIDSYCAEPGYLDALASHVARHWTYADDGRHHLVFTFHSTLVEDVESGDVYRAQAEFTAREVARRLGLPDGGWSVGFQSVFDKRPWLGPLTAQDVLPRLAAQGVTDVALVAPGFTAECLETHFDIDVEQRGVFEQLVPEGTFTYVPCLNDDPGYVKALAGIVRRHIV